MRIHEALLYLPHRNLDPLAVIECQAMSCTCSVQLARAYAFPAQARNATKVHMAFFCSEACYLAAVPPDAMHQA